MYANHLRCNILVALIIVLLLLMMQLEKLGFIELDINMMCLLLLRSGNLWLRMRHGKYSSVLELITEMINATRSLIVTIHTMGSI